jgi:hypothetical protein
MYCIMALFNTQLCELMFPTSWTTEYLPSWLLSTSAYLQLFRLTERHMPCRHSSSLRQGKTICCRGIMTSIIRYLAANCLRGLVLQAAKLAVASLQSTL